MRPWTAWLGGGSGSYSPLPASPSPSPSTVSLPGGGAGTSKAHHPSRRLVALLVAAAASLAFLAATALVAVVPDSHLPSAVSQAKQGVVASWHWDTASEVQELADEFGEAEDLEPAAGSPREGEGEGREADLPVVHADGEVDAGSSGEDDLDGSPAMDEDECPASVQEQVGQPAFWAVTETAALQYAIAPREHLGADIPSSCLSHAVFSARLLSVSPGGELDSTESQTVVALDRPRRSRAGSSYSVSLPSDLAVPRGRYALDVQLNFGFYRGVVNGEPCGQGATTCDELALAEKEGDQLRFMGEPVEVLSAHTIELGQDSATDLALCTDLSTLAGHWSSLAFFPATPPCTLATPSLPLAFLPREASTSPLWVHVVGDSNSRNMFTHLAASLGGGRKFSAAKIVDSPTHNGTHASVALRFRSGGPPADDEGALPDLVLTWQWWYQAAPSAAELAAAGEDGPEAAFDAAVQANREELVSVVDTDLASFLAASRLQSALKQSPALASVASKIRPHRTYLSLGSHGEQLSLAGVSSSLDALFSESGGLTRAARDRANLRLFTTTLVNARYIPLARFPHQDLVRNNALVAAKNAFAAHHPALGGEGRVLDVEALTRGIVDSDGWMKASRAGPDAVHFRGEVYDEWVRVVWTDLLQGVAPVPSDAGEALEQVSVEETRRRWKRRLAWDESLDDDDDDDGDGEADD
ncbi:hypothetical protein DMC30DRAFT_404996 [Rhodotorula diobovata]|uniref:Uncharacterized protein n=1 Tax=Rhodotorula diobovata TaxID=5288 RepID=A0A5C5FLT4_9BASI|nr:hypothetical protein DMC30DRAFT_404996 [Rhodotorula diobovata]